MSRSNFESILGSDLYTLATSQKQELIAVNALGNGLRASTCPRAFRLEFDSGLCMKGRRLFSGAHARRVAMCIEAIDETMLPKLSGRFGTALLLEWVKGDPVSSDPAYVPGIHDPCADFQARLHHLHESDIGIPPPRVSIQGLTERLHNGIGMLNADGMLSEGEVQLLVQIAAEPAPQPAAVYTHDDLCGENLVIDESGCVRIIDNEGLGKGYLAHDLARTIYRWSMDTETEERYLSRYEMTASARDYRRHREFWMAVVLVESACYRMASTQDLQAIPIAGLSRLLRPRSSGGRLG